MEIRVSLTILVMRPIINNHIRTKLMTKVKLNTTIIKLVPLALTEELIEKKESLTEARGRGLPVPDLQTANGSKIFHTKNLAMNI